MWCDMCGRRYLDRFIKNIDIDGKGYRVCAKCRVVKFFKEKFKEIIRKRKV